jgi:hypothetical protein
MDSRLRENDGKLRHNDTIKTRHQKQPSLRGACDEAIQ